MSFNLLVGEELEFLSAITGEAAIIFADSHSAVLAAGNLFRKQLKLLALTSVAAPIRSS